VAPADLTENDLVSTPGVAPRIERGDPVADGEKVVADLGCLGAPHGDLDGRELRCPDVSLQERAVVPAPPDLLLDVAHRRPTLGHEARPSRRARYSSIVIVWSREKVPPGLSTNPIAFT
jgi:hypothetical protein